jgi:hypothetical protein
MSRKHQKIQISILIFVFFDAFVVNINASVCFSIFHVYSKKKIDHF